MAQLLYEQRAAQAKESGLPPLPEPLTQPGREARKKIRRLAEHPRLVRLGGLLRAHFESAKGDGMGAFESLPLAPATLPPDSLTTLSDADRKRIKQLLGDLRSIPIMIRNSNAASGR